MRRSPGTGPVILTVSAILAVSCQETTKIEDHQIQHSVIEAKQAALALQTLEKYSECRDYIYVTKWIAESLTELASKNFPLNSVKLYKNQFKQWVVDIIIATSMLSHAYLPNDASCRSGIMKGGSEKDVALTFELGAYLISRLYYSQIRHNMNSKKLGLKEEMVISFKLARESRKMLKILLSICEEQLGKGSCSRMHYNTTARLLILGE